MWIVKFETAGKGEKRRVDCKDCIVLGCMKNEEFESRGGLKNYFKICVGEN